MIEEIRREVLSIIEHNKANEITRHSNVRSAGVYMLYVDCFQDDSIIPFYIGQTSDFQERHKQHFTEVMALNRLDRECYKYALFADLYSRHARPCKIFSYMVNHGCSLKDLHMIVLELVDEEQKRIEIEQKYIDDLYAPFFGFNQLNSTLRFVESHYGNGVESEYERAIEKDIEQILQFPLFGYSIYNWYRVCHTFYRTISKKNSNQAIPNVYMKVLESSKRLHDIHSRCREIRNYNGCQAEEDVWAVCKDTINAFFAERKLKSEIKKKLVVKVWLFALEEERKELAQYFARYADGTDGDLLERIDRIHGKNIQCIKQRVLDNQCEYRALEAEKAKLNSIVFGALLPKQYRSHPLGAMDESIGIQVGVEEQNVCYLNVEYSCYKANYEHNFYPQITRIDYRVVRDGKILSRTAYIENCLVGFFNDDDIYYMESGFHYGPFNPYINGPVDTYISVTMEYKNGINEWVLRDKETENYIEVFQEVNGLIDEKTKVIYSTSGYKGTILRFSEIDALSGTLLMKKLKRLCK